MKTKEELDSMPTKDLLMHYRQQRNGIISGAFAISDNVDEEDTPANNWIDESIADSKIIEHLKYLDDILTMLGQRQDLTDIMKSEKVSKINLN